MTLPIAQEMHGTTDATPFSPGNTANGFVVAPVRRVNSGNTSWPVEEIVGELTLYDMQFIQDFRNRFYNINFVNTENEINTLPGVKMYMAYERREIGIDFYYFAENVTNDINGIKIPISSETKK